MNSYSEMFEDIVNYDDEDFVENPEKLKNIVVSFRDAAGAMDSFLLMHGYEGNVDDADAKRKFIEKVFLDRGMKPSREIKNSVGKMSGFQQIRESSFVLLSDFLFLRLRNFSEKSFSSVGLIFIQSMAFLIISASKIILHLMRPVALFLR